MKFNEKYHPVDFLQFLQAFLPEDFSEKEEDIIINKERYKVINSATILGYCSSLDLFVLEINHACERDPRVAITTDAFKILADNWIHRALVVFRNKDTENYRLSYLTIALDLNDKNKAIKKYSNARRYSFYLGANAKVRTPEQQLIKKGRIKDINDLLSRFSVEVVNKQFYLEVAKFFDELVLDENKNLSLPSISQENVNIRKSFAVRLIGRLMFCWFLKQKKSESGQLIPDELLSSAVAKKTNNYYHGILEPLFFEVLNTSIDTRGIRSELFDKVPYLNGGLFNPQSDDYYELDRDTFFSKYINTLSISDQWFIDFFELLELYNFTIDENTVFDQELSVDPEMLGRIFENLLAEINPETGNSERKRTGTFYTPRQIVEYMVDQSLVEYLKTKTGIDEKKLAALMSYDLNDDMTHPLLDEERQKIVTAIETLKLLDPACGSGAYPIGALQKIVYILQCVDPDCKLWLNEKLKDVPDLYKQKIMNEVHSNPFNYTRKLDVIKNSVFGVDIQPIAVDVSRLRCFLTLIVESEINDTKPNRGIESLPNLDFKFVCANTLIGLPKVESSSLFEDHTGIAELSKIMSEYFSCNSQRKNEVKLRFLHIQKEILENTVAAFGKNTGELTLKLTTWNPFSNHSNDWFDPEWMFGIEEKFDIVIGNPPYIKEYTNKSAFNGLRNSEYYQGKTDLWSIFTAVSIDYLKKKGTLSFIGPNNWATNAGSSILRNKIIKETEIKNYVDFGDFKVFEQAGIQTMILILSNTTQKEKYQVEYLKITGKTENEESVYKKVFSAKTKVDISPTEMINKNLTFSTSELSIILDKIRNGSNFKLTEQEVAQGIVADPDRAFIFDQNQEFTHKENACLKKYFTSVGRFSPGKQRGLIAYLSKSKNYLIEEFINIKTQLLRYQEDLQNRREVKSGRLSWFNLHWPRDEKFFGKGSKIVCGVRVKEPSFYYTEDEYYGSRALNFIKTERLNLKYLTGLLNSKLVFFWLKNRGKQLGSLLQVDKGPLLEIPLCIGDEAQEKEMLGLVDQVLTLKKQNKDANTKDLELKIDQIVYRLYNLTEEEIKIIENN